MESNLKNMSLVLTLTCLVCSGVLAVAYAVTKEPIEAAAAAKSSAAIAKVLPAFENVAEESIDLEGITYTYYKATSGDALVGYAVKSTTSGFGGALTLIVGVTPDGVVYNTSVLSHSETPGLGAKCETDKAFMSQWQGFNPAEKSFAVRQDGGDVDAITASTITSRAYSLAVSNAVEVFKALQPDAASGASLNMEEPSDE